MTPTDRRMWRDFVDQAWNWRRHPSDANALHLERVGRAAFTAVLPVAEGSAQARIIATAVLRAKLFHKATFLARDAAWPEIENGVDALEAALAPPKRTPHWIGD